MDIEAFILIGGRSERFGSDKAFYELENESLAMRAVRTVETAFPQIRTTFVAASDEQFCMKTESLGRPVIFDRRKGFGAWSGLDAALSYSRSEWTLVMACDLPFVTPIFLLALSERLAPGVDAVVPRQRDGRLQPLCALYRTGRVLDVVRGQLASADSLPPLARMIDGLSAAIVEPSDAHEAEILLKNINWRRDLE